MCRSSQAAVCVVEEKVLSQLVASTVMSSVLCGETFYMGGGVKAKRFRPPSLSESGRRGVGACSMSSSVQETVTNEKKNKHTTVPRRRPRRPLVLQIQSSELSVVMNGVWNVLERNSSTAFASGNLESAMTKALETGKIYESPQLSET